MSSSYMNSMYALKYFEMNFLVFIKKFRVLVEDQIINDSNFLMLFD